MRPLIRESFQLFRALPALAVLPVGVGCVGVGGCDPIAEVESGEWLPGGEATNVFLLGRNAFLAPAPNLTPENEAQFFVGNSFFNDAWVEAPASTGARDGLGPLFNARACAVCHFRDGRAKPPDEIGESRTGTLIRLGLPEADEMGSVEHPTYGGQLQDNSISSVEAEGIFQIDWEEIPGTYGDGMPFSLRKPHLQLDGLNYGEVGADVMLSLRVAPQMIGLGLLEGIPVETLEQLEAEGAREGSVVSGRIAWGTDAETGETLPGRFGWKGERTRVRTQTAAALHGDVGITSSIFPQDTCTTSQLDCSEAPSGGQPEVEEEVLHGMALYSAALAVPVRRDWDDSRVLRGKYLFAELQCSACHVPSHRTGDSAPIDELSGQVIWPYTDLLLHDMGEGLSDGLAVGRANGREWKTPPLWGLGFVPVVNGHDRLLHDGRARGFAEAILWHGGEAESSREAFRLLPETDREALVLFLGSL